MDSGERLGSNDGTFSHSEIVVPLTRYSSSSEGYESLQGLGTERGGESSASRESPSVLGVGFDSRSTFRTVNSPSSAGQSRGYRSGGDYHPQDFHLNELTTPRYPENEHDPLWLASKHVESWMESFENEQAQSGSLVAYLHKKLQEALRSSDKLGNPNEFRTAVCCHLLDVICRTFGRYSDLIDQLKMEVYASIYIDKDELFKQLGMIDQPTARTFIQFQPYFRKVERLLVKKEQLEDEVAKATRQRNRMKEELNKKQKVLDATAQRWQKTLVEQCFRTWLKTLRARKQQREMLYKYFVSKDKSRLALALREWRLFVHTRKRQRANEDLTDARDKVMTMENERAALERDRDVANEKIADLKEELEKARTELAELDDDAVRVQRELSESKEDELVAAARAWAEMCDTACMAQMKALRHKLDALDEDPFYADVTLLANAPIVLDKHGTEKRIATIPPHPIPSEIEDLEQKGVDWKNDRQATVVNMPVDILLLRWCNFHLKREKYPKIVENFGSDMEDSEELAVILAACSRALTSPCRDQPLSKKLQNFDIEARAEEIVQRVAKLGAPSLIESDDIVFKESDSILSLIAYLFCNYPELQPDPKPWVIASDALDRAIAAWLKLKEQWMQAPVPPAPLPGKKASDLKKITPVDESDIKKVGQQVMAACTAAKNAIARHDRATLLYERVRLRVRNFGWEAMNKRAEGTPITILDRRDYRERQAFTSLRVDQNSKRANKTGSMWARFKLEADPVGEIKSIETLLNEYFDDLKRIYRHYSSSKPGSSGTIDLAEFGMLMHDIKLSSRIFKSSVLENIFRLTNKTSASSKKFDAELDASEFIEALLRVASMKFFKKSYANVADDVPANALTYTQLFRKFMEENVIPFACRSDAERFRKDLRSDVVKVVFRKHRGALQKIFQRYSKGDGAMDSKEFLKFVRDRQLINNSLSETELFQVFAKVQDDEGAFHSSVGALGLDEHGHDDGIKGFKLSSKLGKLDVELTYPEFLEAIAAISIFKDPDPYIPLKQKIESFLLSDILVKV